MPFFRAVSVASREMKVDFWEVRLDFFKVTVPFSRKVRV